MTIEVGDMVRLKTTEIGSLLGITPVKKQGGEARVLAVSNDGKGEVITVELIRSQRQRKVRRDDLIVHHKTKAAEERQRRRKR